MRLPRNLSAGDLANALGKLGYQVTRQKGSYLRLTTQEGGEHHLTLPNHSPLRIGLLSSILHDVAGHFGMSREELVRRLFE
jgi:predicted RNA binding protein YcfA (HicA-like mRNA interferase family)